MFRLWIVCVAIVGASLLSGCHLLTTHAHHQKKEVETAAGTVVVGGAVAKPQAFEIPASGLTLTQALTRVGPLPSEDPEDDGRFVSLERTNRRRPETYLLPLALVNQAVAGKIPLRSGDVVQVIPFNSTRLYKGFGGAVAEEPKVELRGLVPRPGRYDANVFSSLFGDSAGGDPIRLGASVATLTRVSGLTTEIYILPLEGTPGSIKDFLLVKIKHGDVITFTTPERIPIVISGFIENLRRSAAERADELSLQARRARQRQQKQLSSPIPGVDAVRSAGRTVRGLLPF